MKKIFAIFVSLFIFTSCEIFSDRNYYFFYTGVDVGPYYTEDGNYFYSDYPYVYEIQNDNIIMRYDDCKLSLNNNIVSIIDNNEEKVVGILENNEIDFNKYIIYNGWKDHRFYYFIEYNGVKIFEFYPLYNESCVIYKNNISNDKLYFIELHEKDRLKGSCGSKWDDNYINTILYCVDIKNKFTKVIYSSDNNYVIVYGNEKFVYLIDKNNSIYQYDIKNDKYTLFYETDYVGDITTKYRHNKLFIYEDTIKILDVE